jgi:hypothetical protein
MFRLCRRRPQVEESADSKSTKSFFSQGSSTLKALEQWGTDSYFNDIKTEDVRSTSKVLDIMKHQIDTNKVKRTSFVCS